MTSLAIMFGILSFSVNAVYVLRNRMKARWRVRLLQAIISLYITVLYILIATNLFVIPAGGTIWLRAGIVMLLAVSAAEGLVDL